MNNIHVQQASIYRQRETQAGVIDHAFATCGLRFAYVKQFFATLGTHVSYSGGPGFDSRNGCHLS
jgi:hypothetical protein